MPLLQHDPNLENFSVGIVPEFLDSDGVRKVVVVRETEKPPPNPLKFAAGRGEPGEDPRVAACRECAEETGLRAQPENLRLVFSEVRYPHNPERRHNFFLYHVVFSKESLVEMEATGEEGEKPKPIPFEDCFWGNEFFELHQHMIWKVQDEFMNK